MPFLKVNIKSKQIQIDGNKIEILKAIQFELNQGEFVSIIGPSGCGKTTILNIILGLQTEYVGEIVIEGKKVTKPDLDRGVVFQDHRLLPWLTVKENIAFALPRKQKNDDQITNTINLVGLKGFEKALPRQLSGGMAQRVALARAIVNVPNLLLLDEALGSLDDFTRAKMQIELQSILSLSKTTAIMVTHNIDEAISLSNKVIVLGGSPTGIIDVIEINLKRPVDKKSKEFIFYRNKLMTEL